MLKKIILGLIVSISILSAKSCVCFEIEGKMGEEIKNLIEKYKDSLQNVKVQNTNNNISRASADDILKQVEAKLEAKRTKKIEDDKKVIVKQKTTDGKDIFTRKCQVCHGAKADKEAYNRARALNTLTLEEMEASIKGYQLDQYDRGLSMIMKPYANGLMIDDIEAVYQYIQTLK